MHINGWLILDKPSGITSAHAVHKVKRLLRPEKIGHAGTLDPLASGILPLALGEATKTVAFMMDAGKAYRFTVRWGQETDTDDSQGQVTASSESRTTEAQIRAVMPRFTGVIMQTPPSYSAIKVDGKRSYDMARAGQAVELKSREIKVYSLELECFNDGEATFICHCGKGTYIRSLARDMGREMGCLGHISMLRRLTVGKFDEKGAISLEILEEIVHKGRLQTAQGAARSEGQDYILGGNIPQSVLDCFLRPVESALDDILALEITPDQAIRLRRGQSFLSDMTDNTAVFAKCEGKAVAICAISSGSVKPVRVFNIME